MAAQEISQPQGGNRCFRLKYNSGSNILAQARMRNCKGGRLSHTLMEHQRFFNLSRRNLFSAPIDHFLGPPQDGQKAFTIDKTDVACREPAVLYTRSKWLGFAKVARHEAGTTDKNFTDLPSREGFSRFAADDQLAFRYKTGGAGLAFRRRRRIGSHDAGFAYPIDLKNRAPQDALKLRAHSAWKMGRT